MFILEIAVLVVASKDKSEKATSPTGALSTAGVLSERATERGGVAWTNRASPVPAAGEFPWRRALKHAVQYTGFPWVGRKGSVADILQSSHTVW